MPGITNFLTGLGRKLICPLFRWQLSVTAFGYPLSERQRPILSPISRPNSAKRQKFCILHSHAAFPLNSQILCIKNLTINPPQQTCVSKKISIFPRRNKSSKNTKLSIAQQLLNQGSASEPVDFLCETT